ncbi:MAG: crosslink repair DNA glycosylase YcaQ family protein [Desulfobacterales bacterium]
MKIGVGTTRKLALQAQGLKGRWPLPGGAKGVEHVIKRLGYVQIDTIAVVQRAHHHTIWTRFPKYSPGMLHELQAVKRHIFEYWAHAACYLPMSDYRYYTSRMRSVSKRQTNWFYTDEGRSVTDHVLDRIRSEGPLGAADFKTTDTKKRGSWWDWKPAKQALEMLFDMGKLMVTERRNFQRIYDLTERILPPETDTTLPSVDEMARFVVRRVLAARGFSTVADIRWGWNRPRLDRVLQELTESGEVVPIQISGRKEQFYTLAEALTVARNPYRHVKRLHILSPFDSLLTDRKRLDWLFGFDFRLECYFPANKRKYGYFCLPILWGDKLIGRMDPKADRRNKVLILRTLSFERSFRDFDTILPLFAAKLRAFAHFNGCEHIAIERTFPTKIRAVFRTETGCVSGSGQGIHCN